MKKCIIAALTGVMLCSTSAFAYEIKEMQVVHCKTFEQIEKVALYGFQEKMTWGAAVKKLNTTAKSDVCNPGNLQMLGILWDKNHDQQRVINGNLVEFRRFTILSLSDGYARAIIPGGLEEYIIFDIGPTY